MNTQTKKQILETLPDDVKKACLIDYKKDYNSAMFSISENTLYIIYKNKNKGFDINDYQHWGERDGNHAFESLDEFFASTDFMEFYYYGDVDPLDE